MSKNFVFFPLILIVGTLEIALAQQDRGIRLTIKDPESGQEIQPYNDSWAILIGIDKYKNVRGLDYAVADAVSMKKLLVEKFGFPEKNISLLTDEQATQENIKKAFGSLYRANPDDRVVVFFAGHGETIDLATGGQMGFIVPVEGKAKSAEQLYSTGISMQTVKELSNFIPAKHVLFLIDACYGGLAATGARSLSRETKGYIKKVTAARARQILTAGGRGEQVVERSEWGHSAFTYKLLDGLGRGLADLDNDGVIRGSELASYIQLSVSSVTDNRQTPQFRSFTEDEGEFLFLLPEKPEPIAAVQPKRPQGEEEQYGDLFVKSIPDGAEIFLDDKPTNARTPDLLTKISTGEHTITVKIGEVTATKRLELKPNQMNRVELELPVKQQSGTPEQIDPSQFKKPSPARFSPGGWQIGGGLLNKYGQSGLCAVIVRRIAKFSLTDFNFKLLYGNYFDPYFPSSIVQTGIGINYWFDSGASATPFASFDLLVSNRAAGVGLDIGGGLVFLSGFGVSANYQLLDVLGRYGFTQFCLTLRFIFGS